MLCNKYKYSEFHEKKKKPANIFREKLRMIWETNLFSFLDLKKAAHLCSFQRLMFINFMSIYATLLYLNTLPQERVIC